MSMQNSRAAVIVAAAAAAVSLIAMPGCRGDRSNKPPRQFFPDMDDSPSFRAQSQNPFFPDGRAMRVPVAGTVPYGRHHFAETSVTGMEAPTELEGFWRERDELLKIDDAYYRGVASVQPDGSLVYIDEIPIPVDERLIARGQERFGIYCAVCHGYYGRGEGLVGQRWTGQTVANLMDPKYMDPNEPTQRGKDGFIFHIAMEGVWAGEGELRTQNMPSYKHALSAYDAWAVVAYVRVLQAAQQGTLEDAPAEVRERLRAELAKLPKMPDPAPSGTGQPPAEQPLVNPQDPTPPSPGQTPGEPGAPAAAPQNESPENPAPEGTPR